MVIDFASFDIFSEDYPNLKSHKNELSLTFEKGLPNKAVRIYFTDSKLFVFSLYVSELAFTVNDYEKSIEIKEFVKKSNITSNRIHIKQNSIIATILIKKNNKHIFDFNYINFHYSQPKEFNFYSDYIDFKAICLKNENYGSDSFEVLRNVVKKDMYINGEMGYDSRFTLTYGQLKYKDAKDKLNSSDYILLNDSKSKNCYIASAVYKDIEHPNVNSLRTYRDEVLSKSNLGKLFINKYYKYAPKLVKHLSGKSILNKIIKPILDILVKIIEHKNKRNGNRIN